MTDIGGSVEPGFEGVADAFRANFEEHGEVGAATSVYVGGRKVVDLWGGVADRDAGTPYTEDSLQLVFSTTKGATAACANLLAQRGDLDIDAPGGRVLARVQGEGQGRHPRALAAVPQGGAALRRQATSPSRRRWRGIR